jgi:hypothetical protein
MDIANECLICLEDLGTHDHHKNGQANNYITCKNKSCVATVCIGCMRSYIEFSRTNNQIPQCPNRNCGRYYLLSDIARFPDFKEPYVKCCFNDLIGKYGDVARKTAEIKDNIETLRQLRQNFINERFPQAIAYTASIIMPHKLRKLNKQVIERLQNETNNTRRVCMNLTCNGSLNENLVCLSCATEFCINCEKRRNTNHICDPADIETINAVKQMVRCPKCYLPIFKNEGCNNMTCANCGQDFLYETGEAGGMGGGNITKIETKDKLFLSVIYHQVLTELGLTNFILAIEALEPRIVGDNPLTNILTQYYRNNKTTNVQLEIELARCFEKFCIKNLTNKRYHQAINEIESRIINRTITADYIQQIIFILNQPI